MYCSAADSEADSGDDDRVLQGAVLLELLHHVHDRRGLLPDRDVDADEILALLVDDRIDRDGGLARLAVADDQFALAATDGNHGVDRLQAGLHRLRHRFAPDHARRDLLDRIGELCLDRTLAVDRFADRVDDTADQLRTDRHLENAARTLHDVAFRDVLVVAQHHRADRIALEVQSKPEAVAGKLQHLPLHHVRKSVNPTDAVAHRDHGALGTDFDAGIELLDLALDELADFRGVELHVDSYFVRAAAIASSLPRTEPSRTSSPTRITAPPMSAGSTVARATILRLNRPSSFATSFCNWSSVSGKAEVTLASTTPSSRSFKLLVQRADVRQHLRPAVAQQQAEQILAGLGHATAGGRQQ